MLVITGLAYNVY